MRSTIDAFSLNYPMDKQSLGWPKALATEVNSGLSKPTTPDSPTAMGELLISSLIQRSPSRLRSRLGCRQDLRNMVQGIRQLQKFFRLLNAHGFREQIALTVFTFEHLELC